MSGKGSLPAAVELHPLAVLAGTLARARAGMGGQKGIGGSRFPAKVTRPGGGVELGSQMRGRPTPMEPGQVKGVFQGCLALGRPVGHPALMEYRGSKFAVQWGIFAGGRGTPQM